MAEGERKGPVLLAVGVLVAVPLGILLLRRKPPPEEPPPEEPVGEQVSVEFDQQQVAPGGTIRVSKTWRNTGGAGTRDIYALYGTGLTLETFATEFGGDLVDQYCAAGAEVTTPVDCTVPQDAPPGLMNALVGVAEYVYPTIIFDDYEIVPNAIEVTGAPSPPEGVALTAGWNFLVYPGPTLPVVSAIASLEGYFEEIWYYPPGVPWGSPLAQTYPPLEGFEDLTTCVHNLAYWVKVTQDCFWSW